MKQLLMIIALFSTLVTGVSGKEFSAAEERVMGAYLAFYGRPADAEGLEYWSNRLVEEGGNVDSIIVAFGNSQEYNSRFGSYDDSELVANIYQQLFGRQPEKAGLDYYVGQLDTGSMNLQKISLAILDGVKGSDATTVNNKLAFSKIYAVDNSNGDSRLSSVQLSQLVAKIDKSPQALVKAISNYRLAPQQTVARAATETTSRTVVPATVAREAGDSIVANQAAADTAQKPVETPVLEAAAAKSAEVSALDIAAPVLTLPANTSGEAVGASTEITFSVTAQDSVDGLVQVACTPASGAGFPLGDTTVSCEAQDTAGNSSGGSFVVTIVDSTQPQLQLPANMTVAASDASGEQVNFSATATDSVDGSVAVTCSAESGTQFAVGNTVVDCTAQDVAGNTASASFAVNLTYTETVDETTDDIGPVLSLAGNTTLEATAGSGATFNYSASANDDVDGELAISCSQETGAVFALGDNTVSCEAADQAGNSTSGSFIVTVLDRTAPQLSLPATITVDADGEGAIVSYQASASDSVDPAAIVACTPLSGSEFAVGNWTVSCEATDSEGNSVIGSFAVNVMSGVEVQSTGTVSLSWSVPTTRENGEPLLVGELAGYEIYIIAEASGLDQVVAVSDPLSTSHAIDDLASDTYHFSISSIDTDGLRSSPSGLITTVIPD